MRAVERKRKPVMSVQRWLIAGAAVVICIVAAILIYYRTIQLPVWADETKAAAAAAESSGVTEIDQIYKHVWDSEAWIVEGKNEADEALYVWVDAEGKTIASRKASESAAKDRIVSVFRQSHPDASVIRVEPGLLKSEPVWEVYYSTGASPAKYHYSFYSFDDGTFVDEYHLTGETAS